MSQLNIKTEFNELSLLAQQLDEIGDYDVDMMLSGLRHMLVENTYFYGTFAKNFPEKEPCKVFYDLPVNPTPHQLVYVQLSTGYPKEIRGPHWCYVLTCYGQKMTVIPVTSIKEGSGPARAPYQFDIDEGDGKIGRMHFDDIRSIDKMRVMDKKGYRPVFTPREEIEAAYNSFIGM